MNETEHLQEQRKTLWRTLKRTCENLRRARRLYHSLERRWTKERDEWETCDRKLAMLDGRYHLIEKGKQPEPTIDDLTLKQINEIAKRLGVDLDEDSEIQIEEI